MQSISVKIAHNLRTVWKQIFLFRKKHAYCYFFFLILGYYFLQESGKIFRQFSA